MAIREIGLDINVVVNDTEAKKVLDNLSKAVKDNTVALKEPKVIKIDATAATKSVDNLDKDVTTLNKSIESDKKLNINTTDSANKVKSLKEELSKVGSTTGGLKDIGGVIKQGIGDNLTGVVSSLPLVGGAISAAFGPLLPIIAGVAGAVTLLKSSFDNLTSQELRVDRLSTALQITREEATNLDKELRDNAISDGGDVDEYREAYIKLANQGINATSAQMTQLQALAKQSGRSIEDVADAVAGAKRGETDALGELIGEFEVDGGKIVSSVEGVTAESTKMLDFVGQVIEQKGIGKVLEEDAAAVGPVFDRITGKISAFWQDLTTNESVKVFFSDLLSFIETTVDAILPVIKVIGIVIGTTFSLVVNNITTAFNLIKNVFTSIADVAERVFTFISDKVGMTGESFSFITKAINDVVSYVESLGQSITKFFEDNFGGIIDTISSSIDFLIEKFGFLEPIFTYVSKQINTILGGIKKNFDTVRKGVNDVLVALGLAEEVKPTSVIDSAAGETDVEDKDKDKTKDKEKAKDKAAKADSDRRKSALAEAEKLLKAETDTALFELKRRVVEGEVFEEDAAAQRILIQEHSNQRILELAQQLAGSKSNLFKLEQEEVDKHTDKLLNIQREYELELLNLSKKNQQEAINALNSQLTLKEQLIKGSSERLIKDVTNEQAIRKARGEETVQSEAETDARIFDIRKEGIFQLIALEEEKSERLSVLGIDYLANTEELYNQLNDLANEQKVKELEGIEERKVALFDFLSEVSGQFGEVGQHFAKLFKGVGDLLKAEKVEDKVAAIGEIAKATIAAVVDLIGQVNQLQIDKLDAEIEKRKQNIDAIKEETEAIIERDTTIAEIENKLAEQRIIELEALQEQLPEAQKERAQQDIETERAKIQDVGDIKNKAEKEEQRRINREQKAIEKAEKEKRQIQAETFEAEKAGSIATTIINGAVAIVQAFAQLGPIGGAIAAAVVTALTATQVALIASQENPYRLAEGTLDTNLLRHAGARQGEDSIPALLMPGEAVIPTNTNRKYHKSIEAIFNEKIPSHVLNSFVDSYLKGGTTGGTAIIQHNTVDVSSIVKAIKEKETVSVNIDEQGLKTFISSSHLEQEVVNRKLRINV